MAWLTTIRRAVKPHLCEICQGWIKSGARYFRIFITPEDNGPYTYKRCRKCSNRAEQDLLDG